MYLSGTTAIQYFWIKSKIHLIFLTYETFSRSFTKFDYFLTITTEQAWESSASVTLLKSKECRNNGTASFGKQKLWRRVKMADLNKELNEYLLSSKNEKQFKLTVPSVTIPKANIGKWFGRSEEEEAGWVQGTQKECCPSMTRVQRLVAFVVCFAMGILCFCLSAIYVPVLLLKARKFALLYTLGSVFFLSSFCFLLGPLSYLKSLFTAERRCFTMSYFVTLIGTLYCALHLQSTPLTVLCAVLQLIAMLSFLVSHIPGGTKGLMFFTRMFKSSVNSTLPV